MTKAQFSLFKSLGRSLGPCVLGLQLLACQTTPQPGTGEPDSLVAEPEIVAEPEGPGPHLSDLVGTRQTSGWSPTPRLESAPRVRTQSLSKNPSLALQLSTLKLKGLQVSEGESLREVIDLVRTMTGLPLVVTMGAEQAVQDAGIVFDLKLDAPISARNLFDLLVDLADDEIRWTIRHDVVLFGTPEKIREALVTRLYDVRATTRTQTSFRGPRLDRLLGQPDDSEELAGGVEEAAPVMDGDRLMEIIQSTIEPESWEAEGVSIDLAESGILIVRHTPEVHAQVVRMLARLGS